MLEMKSLKLHFQRQHVTRTQELDLETIAHCVSDLLRRENVKCLTESTNRLTESEAEPRLRWGLNRAYNCARQLRGYTRVGLDCYNWSGRLVRAKRLERGAPFSIRQAVRERPQPQQWRTGPKIRREVRLSSFGIVRIANVGKGELKLRTTLAAG